MSVTQPLPRDPRPHRRVRASVRAALVWATAAAAVNALLWLGASLFGVQFWVQPSPDSGDAIELGPLIIILATLFAGVISGLAAGLLAKAVKKVGRWIIIGGAILTLSSLSAPLRQPDQLSSSAEILLILMHLVTGVLVTYGLVRGVWTDDRAVRD